MPCPIESIALALVLAKALKEPPYFSSKGVGMSVTVGAGLCQVPYPLFKLFLQSINQKHVKQGLLILACLCVMRERFLHTLFFVMGMMSFTLSFTQEWFYKNRVIHNYFRCLTTVQHV